VCSAVCPHDDVINFVGFVSAHAAHVTVSLQSTFALPLPLTRVEFRCHFYCLLAAAHISLACISCSSPLRVDTLPPARFRFMSDLVFDDTCGVHDFSRGAITTAAVGDGHVEYHNLGFRGCSLVFRFSAL
jgi:hypothetical protein